MKDFNTRAEYLEAVAEWKAEYADLTKQIRAAKNEYREAARAFSKCGSYDWKAGYSSEKNKAYNAAQDAMHKAYYARLRLRREATEAIDERLSAKKEAQRQYLAARAEKIAA